MGGGFGSRPLSHRRKKMKAVFAVFLVLVGVFLVVSGMHLYSPDDLPVGLGYAVAAMLSIMGICAAMAGALLLSRN
jgi:drug/metabolite transporter (DMT)-like permease